MTELALHATSGFSMEPFLKTGEKVILRKATARELRPGCLVVYRDSGALICHRLVFKSERGGRRRLYARGDSSWGWPEEVPWDSVEGVVVAVARADGGISLMDRWHWRLINLAAVFLTPFSALAYKLAAAAKDRLRRGA
jgi:hypothetical protein